jgi:hypothetical protein
MKKFIRLNENDLSRLVRRVLEEENNELSKFQDFLRDLPDDEMGREIRMKALDSEFQKRTEKEENEKGPTDKDVHRALGLLSTFCYNLNRSDRRCDGVFDAFNKYPRFRGYRGYVKR